MKSLALVMLGFAAGVAAVVLYHEFAVKEGSPDIEALDEKVSLHLNELESRVAELAS
jgi:hypothetical protein